MVDLLGGRHLDLAERDGDPQPGSRVGHIHRLARVVGPHGLATVQRVGDGLQGEQRCLRLDIVDVRRVGDAGPCHRLPDPGGDLLHHRRPADVLWQDLLAHRVADRQARFVGGRHHAGVHTGEDCRVWRQDPVGAAGPHDRYLLRLVHRPGAPGDEHLSERPVGEDAGVVVDAAIPLCLADDRDNAVGVHDSLVDEVGQT